MNALLSAPPPTAVLRAPVGPRVSLNRCIHTRLEQATRIGDRNASAHCSRLLSQHRIDVGKASGEKTSGIARELEGGRSSDRNSSGVSFSDLRVNPHVGEIRYRVELFTRLNRLSLHDFLVEHNSWLA